MTTTKRFLQLIAAEMQRQGVRRSELARRMGVQPNQLRATLDGHHSPTLTTVDRICRALNCDLSLALTSDVPAGDYPSLASDPKPERNAAIVADRERGEPVAHIAAKHGISAPRVYQILRNTRRPLTALDP